MKSQKLILTPEMITIPDPAALGGKGANLARMTRWGLPVPPWFVIPAGTYHRHFPEELSGSRCQNDPRLLCRCNP